MRLKSLITLTALCATVCCRAQVTLEGCLDKAVGNYPLIERYGLIEKTRAVQLSDINKAWLPRVSVYGQATAQNAVPGFPDMLEDIMTQMGQNVRGLGKLQYKVGADVTQTVWDGGHAASRRRLERAVADESAASVSVQIYAVRERVIDLFFNILLMQEQIARTDDTISLLDADLKMMRSMYANGVAMQCDVDQLEAQLLTMRQQRTEAVSAVDGYRDMLSLYTGEALGDEELVTPAAEMPGALDSNRPELSLFDARTRLNAARHAVTDVALMPTVAFFAQAYYGYPGFNYFESMIKRDMSFNILAGLKLTWNIDAFYTRRNSRTSMALADASVANDREVFLFNNRISCATQTDAIKGLRAVIADDDRITGLRRSIRQAAESQLRNGVIDVTSLLSRISDENQAVLTASYHRIKLLHEIYKLKYTLNR